MGRDDFHCNDNSSQQHTATVSIIKCNECFHVVMRSIVFIWKHDYYYLSRPCAYSDHLYCN